MSMFSDDEWGTGSAHAEEIDFAPAQPATPAGNGGYKTATAGVKLSTGDFGLPYSSIELSATWEFAVAVDAATRDAKAAEIARELTGQFANKLAADVAAQVNEASAALPRPAQPAYASPAPLGGGQQQAAPQAQPTGSPAQQVGQVLNGIATPGQLHAVTNRFGDEVRFPSMATLSGRDMEAAGVQAFAAAAEVHPSHLKAFDCREDLLGPKGGMQAGRIIFAKTSPLADRLGSKSVGWIKFERDGSLKVAPTGDFKKLSVTDRAALMQPAVAAGADSF